MESIRRGVFETNSSSTHSLTMCSESEYDRWKKGELLFDDWNEKFITKEEYQKEYEEIKKKYLEKYPNETEDDFEDYYNDDKRYKTYDEYWDNEWLEGYSESYTTPKGEKVIAFGMYGYNG